MSDRERHSAILVSLHFAPAHASLMIGYAKLLKTLGYDVSFILHPKYIGFSEFDKIGVIVAKTQAVQWLKRVQPSTAIFANAALGNAFLATRMKLRGIAVWYIFHEPDTLRSHLGEGLKDLIKLAVGQASSIAMLLASTGAIVASQKGLEAYRQCFHLFNKNVRAINILCDDELPAGFPFDNRALRRYFSFIGYASEAHGFSSFLAFAKYALRNDCDFDFSIATRSTIPEAITNDPEFKRYVELGRIKLRHGKVLGGEEMTLKYLESFCVWNLYKCTTQSGVLPKAFMTGTPVVANSLGSFPEFIRSGVNGETVDDSRNFEAILLASERIRQNFETYARGCRLSFFSTFHYLAAQQSIVPILEHSNCTVIGATGTVPAPPPRCH